MESIAVDIEYQRLIEDKGYIIYLCNMAHEIEINEAKGFLKKLLMFTQENHLQIEEAWVIHTLGWMYLSEFKFEKVIQNHLKAQEIFAKYEHIKGLISTYNGLMAVYATQELWDLGIEWGIKAVQLARESKDYRALTALLINIVELYLKLNQYKRAQEIMGQIKEISYPLDKFSEVSKYLIYAKCELMGENIEESLKNIEMAYALANKYGKAKVGEVLNVIGQIKVKEKNYLLARKCFEKAIIIAQEYKQVAVILDIKVEWAKLDILEENYSSAIEKLCEAIQILPPYHTTQQMKTIYWCLSRAYKGEGDTGLALEYLEQYLQIEDKLGKEKSEEWLRQLDHQKAETEAQVYKLLYDQVSQLSHVGQMFTATLSAKQIVQVFTEEIKKLIQADCLELATYDEESKKLEYHLYTEPEGMIQLNEELTLSPLWKSCLENKMDLIVNDIDSEYHKYFRKPRKDLRKQEKNPEYNKELEFKSQIVIPLIVGDRIIGIISAKKYEVHAYDFKDLNTLKILGTYIAIALENAKLFEQVKYVAAYDALTKVLNRREILRRGEDLYKNAIEQNQPLGLIMIDVDEFKQINDTYGHHSGDQILSNISQILISSVRKNDLVGRYGGEEFLIVLPNIKIEEVKKIAERVRINVKERLESTEGVNTTVSLGVAGISCEINSLEEMVKRADQALYQAKKTGKNKVVVYNSNKMAKL